MQNPDIPNAPTTFANHETRDLLTVEQAANHLQVSQSSIRGYIRTGRLKAFRIAGLRKVLIPREELMALLEPLTEFTELTDRMNKT